MASEFFHQSTLIGNRGRRECRVRAAPMVRVQQKSTRQNHRSAGAAGIPCAMVLRLIRALPGDQALLSPLPRVISQGVTPALGRQNHTISPSASRHSSRDAPRPSHPASNVRDDREAPLLVAARRANDRCDLPDNARENVHDGQFAHGGNALARLSPRSFRGAKRTRNLEIPGSALSGCPGMTN
jgi:hypothetical protein